MATKIEGLAFKSEVDTVNALVPEVRAKGAGSIVVIVHQGGSPVPDTPYDGCGLPGTRDGDHEHKEAIVEIAERLDPAVDAVITAHTHRPYVCTIGGKLVTSAASYGRVITAIDLTFDPTTHRVAKKTAANVAVTHDLPPDPAVDALVQSFVKAAAPRADRVVGHLSADLLSHATNGESNFGDFIADAMLASTADKAAGGAVVAFMNPGGIRADIRVAPLGSEPPGTVTYGKIFAAQPFGNVLYTVSLSGAELVGVLEEQFRRGEPHFLQVSKGFTYAYDLDPKAANHVLAGSAKIGGVPIDPKQRYRVTVNDFLYNGGDGYKTFREGKDVKVGGVDVYSLEKYFASFGAGAAPVTSPNGGRFKSASAAKDARK
jgi:5'-nucleotidase